MTPLDSPRSCLTIIYVKVLHDRARPARQFRIAPAVNRALAARQATKGCAKTKRQNQEIQPSARRRLPSATATASAAAAAAAAAATTAAATTAIEPAPAAATAAATAAVTPAPTAAAANPAAPFVLATGNLADVEVLKAHVLTIVAPAAKYMNKKVIGAAGRGAVVDRMAAARIFDPRYVKASGLTDAEIDVIGYSFRFVSTMDEYGELLSKMKDERTKYVGFANSIINETLRINPTTGKDTFDLLAFWRGHKGEIPAFAKMFRAVLTYAPVDRTASNGRQQEASARAERTPPRAAQRPPRPGRGPLVFLKSIQAQASGGRARGTISPVRVVGPQKTCDITDNFPTTKNRKNLFGFTRLPYSPSGSRQKEIVVSWFLNWA